MGDAFGQGGRGAASGQPQADLQGEDRVLNAVDRLVEVTPQSDGPEQGRDLAVGSLGATAIPVVVEVEVAGHEKGVVGFEMVVGPLEDDPPQFAERVLELDLKVVAGRGRGFGGAEGDDELSDPGDDGEESERQREEGGGEGCREQGDSNSSMVHRGGLFGGPAPSLRIATVVYWAHCEPRGSGGGPYRGFLHEWGRDPSVAGQIAATAFRAPAP